MNSFECLDCKIVEILQQQGIKELLPIQDMAIKAGILDGKSLLLLAPTSSGKTLLGEIVAVNQAVKRQRTAILVPYKALAEERYHDIQERWRSIGIMSTISTGDYPSVELTLLQSGDVDIVLFTYERFLSLLTQNQISGIFSLIIIDELHLIADRERGPKLEWIITILKRSSPNPQLLCLSAATKELNQIDVWLESSVLNIDSRPTPLIESVALPNGKCEGIKRSSDCIASFSKEIEPYAPDSGRLVLFITNILQKDNSRSILVFRDTVMHTEELAKDLAIKLNFLGPATETIKQLKTLEYSELSSELIGCLERSVAFHNTELTFDERKIIENGFRKGEIKCLVSTATLAMGVNLPCSLVVIGELMRSWETEAEKKYYRVSEYRNMSGRAGRYGISDEEGESIYLANDCTEFRYILNKYIYGEVEPIESALITERLDMMILYTLSYFGGDNSIDKIVSVLLSTFAGSHRWGEEFKHTGLKISISEIAEELVADGLAENVNNNYHLTGLGYVCAHSGLDRTSFVDLVKWLKECDVFENTEYLAKLATLETCQAGSLRFPGGRYRINGSVESVKRILTPESSINTPLINKLLKNLNGYIDYYLADRARLVSTILAYLQGLGNGEIESKFLVRGGTINLVKDKFIWITEIASAVVDLLNKPFATKLDLLCDLIKYGVPETGRHLARLNILRRDQTLKLIGKGITTPLALLEADSNLIAELIYNNQVEKVVKLKEDVLERLGPVFPSYKSQIASCNADIVGLIHQIYASRGMELERPFLQLIEKVAPSLQIKRIKPQRAGEADYTFNSRSMETGIIQLASRGDPNKKIGINKAGEVLHQSPELRPSIFICVGFPNFDHGAEIKADYLGENVNYKIISLPQLIDLIIKIENKFENVEKLYDIFENQRGVICFS